MASGETKKMNWDLILPVIALNVANGVAFCDLLGISAVLPSVTVQFTTLGVVEWSTTSQLIGATVGQCILGYLSDVWSRRNMLFFALLILLCSSIATALAFRTELPILFVVFRALSGVAVGSISSLVNIAQSDISTREQRLKLQGVQGVSVATGSIIGMMAGAVFAQQDKVHNLYWVEAGLSFLALILIARFVKPHKRRPSKAELRGVMRNMDYAGILAGVGFVVPGLILMANFTKLSNPIRGVLAALTGLSLMAYLFIGTKNPFDCRPIVPFYLFRNPTLSAIYLQNLLFGSAYYTFIYFLPMYLMVVRQIEPLKASAIMISYFAFHGIWSAASARVILWLQRRGHRSYSTMLFQGFVVWAGSVAILAIGASSAPSHFPLSVVIVMAAFIGIGTGGCFQNSVLAIKEQVDEETNAVALGVRNVLRYLGGAVGIAVSGIIIRRILAKEIPEDNPVLDKFRTHTINPKELRALPNAKDRKVVMNAYGKGIMWVFIVSTALLVVCIGLCKLIREKPPRKKEDEETAMKELSGDSLSSGAGTISTQRPLEV